MRAPLLFATIGTGLLGASLVACGPTPPPATPTASTGGATPVAAGGAGAADVAPVPEPGDVVLVARWKSPVATFTSVISCAGLPAGTMSEPVFRKAVVESFVKEEVP